MTTTTNTLAQTLKTLHAPGSPIIFANIWDLASLNNLTALNTTSHHQPVKAVATASWAFAACLGIKDEELTLAQNIDAVAKLSPACRAAGLPLSVDLQDGYGARIADAVRQVVELGASGANIEDSIPSAGLSGGIEGALYTLEDQVGRLKTALEAARDAGCPDFVLNARSDVFLLGLEPDEAMDEAIRRGRAFLDAGATTIFYWGGSKGLRDEQVRRLVAELGGRVAVKLASGPQALTTRELGEMGVARISVGPSIYRIAMAAAQKAAKDILEGGRLA